MNMIIVLAFIPHQILSLILVTTNVGSYCAIALNEL